MKKYIIVIIGLLFAFSANAQNQSKTKNQTSSFIVIKVNQKDDANKVAERKLTFTFSELASRSYLTFNVSDTTFYGDISGQTLTLKMPATETSLRIGYSNPHLFHRAGAAFGDFSWEYLVSSGDTIEMDLSRDSIKFSGKKAFAMNLQYELFQMRRFSDRLVLDRNDPNYFANDDSYLQLALDRQLAHIESNKRYLNDRFYYYLRNQSIGYRYYSYVKSISNNFILDPELGDRGAKYYLSHPINVALPDNRYLHEASNFADFLYFKERLDYELENRKPKENIVGMDTGADKILDRIAQKYTGELRDRVLVVTIVSLSKKYIDASTYFARHQTLIPKSSSYYHFFEQIKKNFQPNEKVADFALPDPTGKIVKLSDFKGKVVVLDLWFTGCIPCRFLKKSMEPIVEQFKIRKDVVFMTLSVDKDKEVWINSVKSGEWTHPTGINLLAGPGHPITKKYIITGFPRLMLIDKDGRLASMKLPVPVGDNNKEYVINAIRALL